jgi:NUMOD3 motif
MNLNNNDTTQKNEENEIGIIKTPKELNNIGCKNIGKKKIWTRNCPKCDTGIEYKYKGNCLRSILHASLCKKCAMNLCKKTGQQNHLYGKTRSEKTKNKISNSNKIVYATKDVTGKANPFFGKKHNEHSIEKMKLFHTGKVLSENTRAKIGIARQNRIINELKCKFYRYNESENNLYLIK